MSAIKNQKHMNTPEIRQGWLRQFIFFTVLAVVTMLLAMLILRLYTRHGQKIEMLDLTGKNLTEAEELVQKNRFELIVNDSVFVVGKPGGIILDQNPKPGSFVKKHRKIYITITKGDADKILVENLPSLYGNAYDQKKKELKYREINAEIKSYSYDAGEPNHILEVWYNGQKIIDQSEKRNDVEINKGDTLYFVLSEREGGETPVPDLRCLTLEEAHFILESNKLVMGEIEKKSDVKPGEDMFVISQDPPYDGMSNIERGSSVSVVLSSQKPVDCPE
ncbi:MAG: PASTA domain-containing protein [Saprospiraceae bacterium]|nr:PASTA domain-containing protein [Saprospiraceae bacterium]